MSRGSILVWHGWVRHVTSSCNISLIGKKTLVQRAAGRAGELNLEICEHHLRDTVVTALRVV